MIQTRDPNGAAPSSTDGLAELEEVLAVHGLNPPEIVPDGEIHRFPTNDKGTDKAGYLAVFDHGEGVYGAFFGDWRTGESETWFSRSLTKMDPQRRADIKALIEEAQKRQEKERECKREEAEQRARLIWGSATPAREDHPYLMAKQVPSFGLRESERGRLIVPVLDPAGKTTSLQFIDSDGSKKFLPGGKVGGGCFSIKGDRDTLFIAEGYATGASVHMATSCTVICAFNAGNLASVAQAVRERYPEAKIVIAGDNDQWTKGNPGKTKAEAAAQAVGGSVVLPEFKDVTGRPTDFNDLHRLEGIEAVKKVIEAQRKEPGLFEGDWHRWTVGAHGWLETQPEPLSWTIQDVLLSGVVGFLVGPPATGKTFLLLTVALSVATGCTVIPGLEVSGKPGRVLMLTSEDDARILHRRVKRLSRELFPGQEELIKENVVILPAAGVDVRLMEESEKGLKGTGSFHGLLRLAQKVQPELVVLDPLARLFAGNENDNSAGTVFSTLLEQIAQETGASVLCAHHTTKRAGMDGNKFKLDLALSADNARGASSFLGACRCMITCASIPQDQAGKHVQAPDSSSSYMAFKAVKVSNGPQGDTHYLRRGVGGVLWPAEAVTDDPKAEEERAIREAIVLTVEDQNGDATKTFLRNNVSKLLQGQGWSEVTKPKVDKALEALFQEGRIVDERRASSSGKTARYFWIPTIKPSHEEQRLTESLTESLTETHKIGEGGDSVTLGVVEPFLTETALADSVPSVSVKNGVVEPSVQNRISAPYGEGAAYRAAAVLPGAEEVQGEEVEVF